MRGEGTKDRLTALLPATHPPTMRSVVYIVSLLLLVNGIESRWLLYKGFNYTISQDEGDYYEALTWCTQLGGHLPSIQGVGDIEFLAKSLIRGTTSSRNFIYLGANGYNYGWRWHDGESWPFNMGIAHEYCKRGNSCCVPTITTASSDSMFGKLFTYDGCGIAARMVCKLRTD